MYYFAVLTERVRVPSLRENNMAEIHLLRITQDRVGPDKFRVEISCEAKRPL